MIFKPLTELKPYENNPRINENAVESVANSISEFGFKVPIVLDKNNVIIAGHTRFKAAEKLGLTEVPCIIADDLTDEQVKAFRLADNKVGELAEWDFSKLEEELLQLSDSFSMEDFGFILQEMEEELEKEPKERTDLSDKAGSCYEVIVECQSEEEQQATYEKLTEDGLVCRVLTL